MTDIRKTYGAAELSEGLLLKKGKKSYRKVVL